MSLKQVLVFDLLFINVCLIIVLLPHGSFSHVSIIQSQIKLNINTLCVVLSSPQKLQNMRICNNFHCITASFDFLFTDILLMRQMPNVDFCATFHRASVIKILIIIWIWKNMWIFLLLCKNIFLFFLSFILPSLSSYSSFFFDYLWMAGSRK